MTKQSNIVLARKPLLVLAAVSTLALAVLAGCSSQAEPAAMPPPPTVSVVPVLIKEISQWDEYSGRIEAVRSVDLRPRVSGYIEAVAYHEGQEVKRGEVLFVIDARSYRAELSRAEAELARARSLAAQSRSEVERARSLAAQSAISTELYEQRRAAAAVAEAGVQAASAALETARLNLEWCQVRAPIDGRAGRALITEGNFVSAGDASSVLTTLVSLDQVHVHFDADEAAFLRYAKMARDGERPSERDGRVPVQVALAGEDRFPHQGLVDFLDNRIDRNTGTIRARAVLDNHHRLFTPGLFARVRLLGSGRFTAVLIDETAVLTDQDRKYVWVVDEANTAQRRDVQLGRSADGLRIVEAGLDPGDRVIVNGVQKVFMPGMPVNAQLVEMGTPAPGVAMN